MELERLYYSLSCMMCDHIKWVLLIWNSSVKALQLQQVAFCGVVLARFLSIGMRAFHHVFRLQMSVVGGDAL